MVNNIYDRQYQALLGQAIKADPRWAAGLPAFTVNVGGKDWNIARKPDGTVDVTHGSEKKALLLAAGVAGAAFGAPLLLGAMGGGGGAAAAASGLPTMAGPTAAGVAPAAVGSGFSFGKALTSLAPTLINAGTNIYGAHQQIAANNRASDLERQTALDTLAYTKQRDAQMRQDALLAEQKNLGLYQQSQARLDPYREFGLRSLAQIGRPIPGVGVSLASRMG